MVRLSQRNFERQRYEHDVHEGEAEPAVGEHHQEVGSDKTAEHAQQQGQLDDSRRFEM